MPDKKRLTATPSASARAAKAVKPRRIAAYCCRPTSAALAPASSPRRPILPTCRCSLSASLK
ncbi:MAG: hypothetical protein ACFNKE_09825 [Neisseria elongata]